MENDTKQDAGQVPTVIETRLPADPFQLSTAGIETMVRNTQMRVDAIQAIYGKIMRKDSDYGVIPGCGTKPALLKPGAEKIIMAFRLAPTTVHTITDLGGGHREIVVRTTLRAADGTLLGDGVGSCSTMETKYRYRQAERVCPACGKSTIIKGKAEYGGGWLCFAKKGGCGAKFQDGDPAIEKQNIGRVENADLADQYNTVLKMAEKRSLVDVVLRVAGASDIFTQDIEENAQAAERTEPAPQPATAASRPGNSPQNAQSGTISEDAAMDISFEVGKHECGEGYIKQTLEFYSGADKKTYTDLTDLPAKYFDKIMASIAKKPLKKQ